jgi:hypothetical protein
LSLVGAGGEVDEDRRVVGAAEVRSQRLAVESDLVDDEAAAARDALDRRGEGVSARAGQLDLVADGQ